MTLRAWRKMKGLTAEAMAKRCGLKQSQVTNIEHGRGTMPTGMCVFAATGGMVGWTDLGLSTEHLRTCQKVEALIWRRARKQLRSAA